MTSIITDLTRHEFWYGGRIIHFDLKRSKRTTLGITVKPDSSVEVTAPTEKPIEDVKYYLAKRGNWIARKQRHFEKLRPLPIHRNYVAGETHMYLGRQYRLKIVIGKISSAKLSGPFIRVTVPDKQDHELVKYLVEAWYKVRASDTLLRRAQKVINEVRHLGIPEPELRIRKMTRRWGSCTDKGTVTMNIDLVKVPTVCIDYVIVHELCHLRHKNHGPQFWRLLTTAMPDWEKRRALLDRKQV